MPLRDCTPADIVAIAAYMDIAATVANSGEITAALVLLEERGMLNVIVNPAQMWLSLPLAPGRGQAVFDRPVLPRADS